MDFVLINVIIFLIVLLIINSYVSPIVVKEYFEQGNDSLALNIMNDYGRNIVFPYFGSRNILTATQRAVIDTTSLKTVPGGKCMLSQNQGVLNPSFAIVHEDSLFYTLSKSCIALKLQGYELIDGTNSFYMWFSNKTPLDRDNFAKFILSNPLFVEFSINNNLSVAYTIDTGGFIFSTATDIKHYNQYGKCTNNECIALKFTRTSDQNLACDQNTAFNYKYFSPSQKLVLESDLKSIQQNAFLRDGLVNMWVYYLDELSSNFQSTGRSLPISNPRISTQHNSITVFDTGFKRWATNPYEVDMYEFMNNIALMYYNFIIPVITISFDISITIDMFNDNNVKGNSPYNLIVCTMNNGYGGTNSCQNNLFAIQLAINPSNSSTYSLYLLSGDGNDCGFNAPKSRNLNIVLPWLSNNNIIKITATFGPNQKHIFASWKDINSGDIGKKMLYAKHIDNYRNPAENPCGYRSIDMSNTNNATRLFASKTLNPRPALQNINLTCPNNPRQFVQAINEVTLGYVNLNQYYDKQ